MFCIQIGFRYGSRVFKKRKGEGGATEISLKLFNYGEVISTRKEATEHRL